MIALMSISVASGGGPGADWEDSLCSSSLESVPQNRDYTVQPEPKQTTASTARRGLLKNSRRNKPMKTDKPNPFPASVYLRYFNEHCDAMVETIRQMAEMESPSFSKASVDVLVPGWPHGLKIWG